MLYVTRHLPIKMFSSEIRLQDVLKYNIVVVILPCLTPKTWPRERQKQDIVHCQCNRTKGL